MIYTDLEKAFDKIPHIRLISKLSSYGLNKDITSWIEAFLLNRKQRVRVKETYQGDSVASPGLSATSFI